MFPKSPTCGEVNPNTKLFNVCCGGKVVIENSELDGVDGENNDKRCYYTRRKTKKLLHSLFYDVTKPSAYTGKDNVFRAARAVLSSITRADVDRWFEEQLTYTLHKPVRVQFARNKTIVKSIDDQWQADLCDMQSKSRENDGNTFILTCIDCFSKYAWAESLQQKTADDIIAAMERIFASGRKPKRLQTDKGSEFTNVKVQAFHESTTSSFSQQTVNKRRAS